MNFEAFRGLDLIAYKGTACSRVVRGLRLDDNSHGLRGTTTDSYREDVQIVGNDTCERAAFLSSQPDAVLAGILEIAKDADAYSLEVCLAPDCAPPDWNRPEFAGAGPRERSMNEACLAGLRSLLRSQFSGEDADALVEIITRGFQNPSEPGSPEVPARLKVLGVATCDMRIPTITSFGDWHYTIRNVRLIRGNLFLLLVWGPTEDDSWIDLGPINEGITLPAFGPFGLMSEESDEPAVTVDAIMSFYIRKFLDHTDWQVNTTVRSGIEDWQRDLFRAAKDESVDEINNLTKRIENIGLSLYVAHEAERTFRHRAKIERHVIDQATRELMLKRCDELRHHIGEMRGEIRGAYLVLDAYSQHQQARAAQEQTRIAAEQARSSQEKQERDRHFQTYIGYLAAIVAGPSLLISLYAAEEKFPGLPGADSQHRLNTLAICSVISIFVSVTFMKYAPGAALRIGKWRERKRTSSDSLHI